MLDFVERHKGQCGIVYCLSRKRTEEAAELLREAGIREMNAQGQELARRVSLQ